MPTSTTSPSTHTKVLSPPLLPSPLYPLMSAAGSSTQPHSASPCPSSRLHVSCCHNRQFLGAGRVCGCDSHSQVIQENTFIWKVSNYVCPTKAPSLVNRDVLPGLSQQSTGVCCRVMTGVGSAFPLTGYAGPSSPRGSVVSLLAAVQLPFGVAPHIHTL